MEHNNRPQGRQKYVTDNSKGTARRGSGLNTGPVGSGTRPAQQMPTGEERRTTRGTRSRSPLVGIATLLVLLLGGGGGLFGSGVLSGDGGGSTGENYSYSEPYNGGTGSSSQSAANSSGQYFSGINPYDSLLPNGGSGSSSSSGSSGTVNTNTNSTAVDTNVAPGARAKRTQI